MKIKFEQLDPAKHDRDDFDCGARELNNFLIEQANQRQKKNNAITHVAVHIEDDKPKKTIYGYYTLSNYSVEYQKLPSLNAKKAAPKEKVPALKLGRLARNKLYTPKGFGEIILYDLFRRAIALSQETGIYLIEVDLLNPKLSQFYKEYDFHEYKDNKKQMFITMETALKFFRKKGLIYQDANG